uniref:Uncharacterized protein n=1 Tax=Anguilla anguilla TaxID=7936 RepID=A0A0E9Q2Z3_ANGAN
MPQSRNTSLIQNKGANIPEFELLFNRNAQSTPPSAITVITAQMWGFQVISNSFHLLAGILLFECV